MAPVEELIRGPFAEALRKGRERFNAKFAQAQLSGSRVEPAEFLSSLATMVAPVVDAVAAVAPSSVAPVADHLYDIVLLLQSKGLLGATPRHPAVVEGWRRLLPAAAPLVAGDARAVAGAVTNALVNLSAGGAKTELWIDAMTALARRCELPGELLAAGQLVAWRSGMAQYRASALAQARGIRPALAAQALGLPDDGGVAAALGRLEADPWLDPAHAAAAAGDAPLRVVAKVGAFRGFGGAFRLPPRVACSGGRFVATDGRSSWFVFADRFGATLIPAGPAPGGAAKRAEVKKDGTIRLGDVSARFPALVNATSSATDGTTVAVTLPESHRIHLVACQA